MSARSLLSQEGTMAEAVGQKSRMDRLEFCSFFHPSLQNKDSKKECLKKVHPFRLCSLVKQKLAPFIRDSAAPSTVPG